MYEKIYSRRRFLIKPCFANKFPQMPKEKKRKVLKIIIIISIIFIIIKMILNSVEPVFETMCEERAKAIATIISNKQSTIIMNQYRYEELFTIEKDNEGNITLIKSNIVPMNNMISDLTGNIQNEFDELKKTKVEIPLGSAMGRYILSGTGPSIPIRIAIMGNVDTELKNEFTYQGINQTLHRIYLQLDCKMKIITPLKNFERNIINQVVIAEHVIIGKIPETYYNLEGMETRLDAMEVIN